MRVLIIHRYFWPDTPPYASMLRSIADRWAADGHDVTILTSQPSYGSSDTNNRQPARQTVNGLDIRRVWLFRESKKHFVARAANLVLFMTRIFLHIVLRRKSYDVVMAATTPPVMIAWVSAIGAKFCGAKVIYHCQDIHPEMMHYAKLLDEGFVFRWLQRRDTMTVRRSSVVVVLSRDMKDTLETRAGRALPKIVIMNNFTVPHFGGENPLTVPDAVVFHGRFRVLFAGNLGYFQGLDAVIDAAILLRAQENIEFVFLGDGAAKNFLVERAGNLVGNTVHFLGHRSQREAEEFARNADLSLITLGPDIYRTAFPSKTMTYLKMGSPILVVLETDSELADITRTENVGFVSPPGDSASIADNVLAASRSPETIATMRENAAAVCARMYDIDLVTERWSKLLSEVCNSEYLSPVFLIGAGRSGTKFLRDTLGAAPSALTVPYDVGYIWRTGNESVPHDELLPNDITDATRRYIRKVLPKLANGSKHSGRQVLLEKSVPNALRVSFVHAIYPEARFIHLVRDGMAVTESSIRQWRKPPETGYLLRKLRYFPWSNFRYALWYLKNMFRARLGSVSHIWGPRYAGMEDDLKHESMEVVCARQWKRCVESSLRQLDEIPDEQVLEVRYEELVTDENVIRGICQFAGIEDTEPVLEHYRRNLIPGTDHKWRSALSADMQNQVHDEIGVLMNKLGFSR